MSEDSTVGGLRGVTKRLTDLVNRITPRNLRLINLDELARSNDIDGQQVIRTLFDWRRERLLTFARGLLAFSASLFVGLGIALFKQEVHTPAWTWIMVLIVALLFVVLGALLLVRQLPRLQAEYLTATLLYDALRGALRP